MLLFPFRLLASWLNSFIDGANFFMDKEKSITQYYPM